MKVCLGGTFDVIHKGHRALLARAFQVGDGVFIGVTDDVMARAKGPRRPEGERRRDLEAYLASQGYKGFEVSIIHDRFGTAADRPDLEAIVVSPDTQPTALLLNEARLARGFRPLEVITVLSAIAEDGLPISTTRIKAGEIDAEGQMTRPLAIAVGSTNPVKVAAVRAVARRVFSRVRVKGVEVASGVPPQPLENDTILGAINRAREALGRGDYGVGIEAGLFWNELAGRHFDVQWCAVVDKAGGVTVGHGPGFYYPRNVMGEVRGGGTVGEALEKITGIENIGRREGAIGYLSGGRFDRRKLTEAAILMALVPRIQRDLYGGT